MSYKLVVGLGNPGGKYRHTRHNLGFEVLDRIVRRREDLKWSETSLFRSTEFQIEDSRLILAWPLTYMNRSGEAVLALLSELGLNPSHMLVVVDDFNLPLGTIRFRSQGTDGGHNGLASIIEALGHKDFPRLRLGIGPVPEGAGSVDFVLERFADSELEQVESMVAKAAEAVIFGAGHRFDEVQSNYNNNPALPEIE